MNAAGNGLLHFVARYAPVHTRSATMADSKDFILTLKKFIKAGATLNQNKRGQTPLVLAV